MHPRQDEGTVLFAEFSILFGEAKPSNLRIRDVKVRHFVKKKKHKWFCFNSIIFLRFRAFIRHFLSKATYSNSYIHTPMVVAAMQDDDQHIRSSLEFSILPKDTSTCRPGESKQKSSDNKRLALTPEPQPPCTTRKESSEHKHCDLSLLNSD